MTDLDGGRTPAPAKINLFLHVGPARADGRHPLDSLVMFAGEDACDWLEVTAAADTALTVTGAGAGDAGPVDDNLVLRAVRALAERVPELPGLAITLEKALPVAAGLGGGSADAGAVLRMCGALAGLSQETLLEVAATLGGDVPACVLSTACRMQDDGARVTALSGIPPLPALLVNPRMACPTGPVFRHFDTMGLGRAGLDAPWPAHGSSDAGPLIDWLAAETANDLEAPAIDLLPDIGGVLDTLRALDGTRLVRMSGSGASCFALFETSPAAAAAHDELVRLHPDWWARAVLLR